MEIIHSDVRHFKPKQDTLAEYLSKEEIPRKFLLSLLYTGVIFTLLASFNFTIRKFKKRLKLFLHI